MLSSIYANRNSKQVGSATAGFISLFLVFAVVIGAIYGYIENILKLCRIEHVDGHIGELVIRIVGIFTGVVGVVAGYF